MVKITKGGKAPIGVAAKAPGGKYVHVRQHAPDKKAEYITVHKGNKEIRLMKKPGSKHFIAQSVLTKTK